jgi:hypothetical protein
LPPLIGSEPDMVVVLVGGGSGVCVQVIGVGSDGAAGDEWWCR